MRTPADRRGQVEQALATLATHGHLIAEGLDGSVLPGDKPRNRAIDALAAIKALSPYEEGEYRLNPRLREFISDHLESYNAFQVFTRLTEQIRQARHQWSGLRILKEEGKRDGADRLQWSLDDTVTEIVYAMDRNLILLNSQLSTDYGNVESHRLKSQQSRFYDREINNCRRELDQLDVMIEEIAGEALSVGFQQVRVLVNVRLMSRMLGWRGRLNDCQAIISKRLGEAQKIESRIKNLGRVSLWMAQNKTAEGFDVDLDDSMAVELLTPEKVKVKWNLDVTDNDPVVHDCMAAAATAMPKPRAEKPETAAPPAQEVRYTEQEEIDEEPDPVDAMIELAASALAQSAQVQLSLAGWYAAHITDLEGVTEEEWLLYSSRQLAVMGFKVDFQLLDRTAGIHNDLFSDVSVTATA